MEETNIDGKVNEEELENVAGGKTIVIDWQVRAKADGRTVLVLVNRTLTSMRDKTFTCPGCGTYNSTYAREKVNVEHGLDEYHDTKCYNCNQQWLGIQTDGHPYNCDL